MLETIRIIERDAKEVVFEWYTERNFSVHKLKRKLKPTTLQLQDSIIHSWSWYFVFVGFFFLQRASKPTLSGVLLWCKKWWSQGVEFSLWTVSKVICCKRKTAVSFWFGRCKWTLALKQVQYLRRKENEAWIPLASRKIIFFDKTDHAYFLLHCI